MGLLMFAMIHFHSPWKHLVTGGTQRTGIGVAKVTGIRPGNAGSAERGPRCGSPLSSRLCTVWRGKLGASDERNATSPRVQSWPHDFTSSDPRRPRKKAIPFCFIPLIITKYINTSTIIIKFEKKDMEKKKRHSKHARGNKFAWSLFS